MVITGKLKGISMELIDIIIYMLKIFSLATVATLVLSYIFFKVKDRTRIKPYMLVNSEQTSVESPVFEVPVFEAPKAAHHIIPLKPRHLSNRFKVLNEEQTFSDNSIPHTPEAFYKPAQKQRPLLSVINFNSEKQISDQLQKSESKNIYRYYSPSEQMHKVKVGNN